MKKKGFGFVALLTLASSGFAAEGVEVGDRAPGFELQDSEGQSYALSQLKGKNVILEFIRSGSW